MITIRFDSKFQIIAQLFDSLRNEKNTIGTALVILCVCVCVLKQFSAFMAVVKEMITQVESEHHSKLEQLHTLHQENRSTDFPQFTLHFV